MAFLKSRRVNAQEPCHYARQETRWWCWRSETIGLWRSQCKVDGAASDVGRVFLYHRQEWFVVFNLYIYFILPDEKKEEKPETSQSTSSKTSDDEIKQLNAGVMKWIKLCLDNDPICDLRPVFEDYKKYIEKLDKVGFSSTYRK